MTWSFFTSLLEEIHNHSTFVGKMWLTVLLVFRIVLTVVGGESIYNDEQSYFRCNTIQPGCENVCYNAFAPLSHIRFWVFQIILVATPSLIYLSYAVNKITRLDEDKQAKSRKGRRQSLSLEETEEEEEKDSMIYVSTEMERQTNSVTLMRHDGQQRIKRDGLMGVYVLQLVIRFALEISFLIGQYMLYGFVVPAQYICSNKPCPNKIDCFISRPMEKTIFLFIMYAVTAVCILLDIWEMFHLGLGTMKELLARRQHYRPDDEGAGWHQQQYWSTEDAVIRLQEAVKNSKSKRQRDKGKRHEHERSKRDRSRGGQGSHRGSSKSDKGNSSVWV